MLLLPLYTQNYIITPNITTFQKATRGKSCNKCSKDFHTSFIGSIFVWHYFQACWIERWNVDIVAWDHELTPLSHHSLKNRISVEQYPKLFMQKKHYRFFPKVLFIWVSFQRRNFKNNPKSIKKNLKLKLCIKSTWHCTNKHTQKSKSTCKCEHKSRNSQIGMMCGDRVCLLTTPSDCCLSLRDGCFLTTLIRPIQLLNFPLKFDPCYQQGFFMIGQ